MVAAAFIPPINATATPDRAAARRGDPPQPRPHQRKHDPRKHGCREHGGWIDTLDDDRGNQAVGKTSTTLAQRVPMDIASVSRIRPQKAATKMTPIQSRSRHHAGMCSQCPTAKKGPTGNR